MTHEIVLADEAALAVRSDGVVLDLAGSSPERVSLGLCLLSESLVEDVPMRSPKGRWVVRLRKSMKPHAIRLRRYGNERLELNLGQVELERWLVFFLKYYRDGWAEVDHLDSDGTWEDGTSIQLILKVCTGPAALPT
jgi:hypothetical protein